MVKKQIIHAIILSFTILGAFLFIKTDLKNYDLQITAALFIILYLTKKIIVPNSNSRLIESVIFTFVILTIVNSTGALDSPFYFLIYFLLFATSLLLEPIISIVVTINLIVYFLLSLPADQNFKQLLPIISLAFLTPFAMYLGKQYQELQKAKIKSQRSQQDTYLFLSLIIKNHLKNIKNATENFLGDQQLSTIRKNVDRIEGLIEKFEQGSPSS